MQPIVSSRLGARLPSSSRRELAEGARRRRAAPRPTGRVASIAANAACRAAGCSRSPQSSAPRSRAFRPTCRASSLTRPRARCSAGATCANRTWSAWPRATAARQSSRASSMPSPPAPRASSARHGVRRKHGGPCPDLLQALRRLCGRREAHRASFVDADARSGELCWRCQGRGCSHGRCVRDHAAARLCALACRHPREGGALWLAPLSRPCPPQRYCKQRRGKRSAGARRRP